jgi:cytochrome c-type biogenesis protein CcmH/NrfG
MKFCGSLVVFLAFWTAAVFAQMSSPPLALEGSTAIDPAVKSSHLTSVLSGRVVSEDNSPPSQSGSVVLQCATSVRARSEIDPKGNFTLTLATSDRSSKLAVPLEENPALPAPEFIGCELYADLPGYRSEHLRLEESPGFGVVNVGTITVHPMAAQDQRFVVSVTSLQAPEKAKKAFQKGRDQERKGRWAAACQYFQRAIAAYPRYALAWLELGRSELKQNSFRDAEQSFQQAVRQDSRLMEGYVELARLAISQQNWKELADSTARLLELAPDAGPQYWFLNSAAHFNLNQISEAETAIDRGLRLDQKHQVPQMEYLYGLILARKKDYRGAAEHIRAYLRLSPHASDADRARSTLSELARLTADGETGNPPSGR